MSENYQPGDIIFATSEILNDGSVPDVPENALIAAEGARGVVINEGHLEEFPDKTLYLVRFEGVKEILGPPVGVWAEEITQAPMMEQSRVLHGLESTAVTSPFVRPPPGRGPATFSSLVVGPRALG